jgi:FtsH-binding integral membrane protein
MASGVLLTGIVALLFTTSGMVAQLFLGGGILKWVVILAPLGIVFFLGFRVHTLSEGAAQALFWAFAVVMGLSMSTIFLVYTGPSIAMTFFATAAAFAGLSLYGYTTQKDLSRFGTFLIMGVVGLLIAMLLNIFFRSPALAFAISAIGVLLFAGLTAYDAQKIKSMYFSVQGSDFVGRSAIMGALALYLDFINMFTFMLHFMGDRR